MASEHGQRAHALFSASGSHRWLNCPGSIQMILSGVCPPDAESSYAAEGTKAHECLEFMLQNRDKLIESFVFAKKQYGLDMAHHCKEAAEYIVQRHADLWEADFLIESKVSLEFINRDMFGTLDVALVEDFGKLVVVDFKYGAGIAVDPDENSQLLYYALGIAHEYDYNFSEVELVVIQPRAYHESRETIRSWTTDIDTLFKWRDTFADGVKKAMKKSAPKQAGEWCRFCPGATVCDEISKKALKEAKIAFDDGFNLELPSVAKIAIDDLDSILGACTKLEAWISKIKAHAHLVLQRGEAIPGWKLVQKRPVTKWLDDPKIELEARAKWGDLAFAPPKLLTPTQLKDKLKKIDAKGSGVWVIKRSEKKSSGLVMVPEGDARPAVNPLEQVFEKVPLVTEEKGEGIVPRIKPKRKAIDPKKLIISEVKKEGFRHGNSKKTGK